MSRVTATLLDAAGAALANARVIFRRLSLAGANSDGDVLPIGGAVVVTTTDTGEVYSDTDGDPGVVLGAGRWMVTWSDGPTPSRLLIEVPDDSSTHAIADLVVASGGSYGLIYWGRAESETLDGDGVAALGQSAGRSSVAGTYAVGAASGYVYLAWPDIMRPPVPSTGIWDTTTNMPASMAGPEEGYDQSQDGWSFRLVNVLGRAYRLYRMRQAVTDAITLRIS